MPRRTGHRWLLLLVGVLALLGAILAVTLAKIPSADPAPQAHPPAAAPAPAETTPAAEAAVPPTEATPTAAPPPGGLPVIDYGPAPAGFPADPAPLSTARLGEGLHPTARLAAYDEPGGRPLAFLPPDIRGADLTMPIVERRAGWAAVILPSANRTIAWVPPGPWTTVPLRDHLIVARKTHELVWLRDDVRVRSWPVSLGEPSTPTPLGRTFVLGRSKLPGRVYAGTDVFALGAVPDDLHAVPTGLRGAHIGLHTWYHDRTLRQNVTNGCIRLTKTGQQLLLSEIRPGTVVVVVDRLG